MADCGKYRHCVVGGVVRVGVVRGGVVERDSVAGSVVGRDRGGGRGGGRIPICLLAMHQIIGFLSNLSVIFILILLCIDC